jgi:hypothetical protein
MAALVPTNTPNRHVLGDYVVRHYVLSGTNGDTFTPGSQSNIAFLDITPTTAIAVGATVATNVITFVTVGAWAATVAVFSREG